MSRHELGDLGLDHLLADVGASIGLEVDVAACCVETTTVSTRTGLSPSYSIVTWVLPSGRR